MEDPNADGINIKTSIHVYKMTNYCTKKEQNSEKDQILSVKH